MSEKSWDHKSNVDNPEEAETTFRARKRKSELQDFQETKPG